MRDTDWEMCTCVWPPLISLSHHSRGHTWWQQWPRSLLFLLKGVPMGWNRDLDVTGVQWDDSASSFLLHSLLCLTVEEPCRKKKSNHTHYSYIGMFEELGEHRQREDQQRQIAGRTLDSYESTHQKGKCVVWPATPSLRAGALISMAVLGPAGWLLPKLVQI